MCMYVHVVISVSYKKEIERCGTKAFLEAGLAHSKLAFPTDILGTERGRKDMNISSVTRKHSWCLDTRVKA